MKGIKRITFIGGQIPAIGRKFLCQEQKGNTKEILGIDSGE